MEDKIAAFWEATIAKIQKYYPKAKFIDYNTVWGSEIISFIVSPKKQWVFDMLNKVLCNYGESGYHKPSHPGLSADCNRGRNNHCYKTEDVCFSIGCHRYLNGNSLVSIEREYTYWGRFLEVKPTVDLEFLVDQSQDFIFYNGLTFKSFQVEGIPYVGVKEGMTYRIFKWNVSAEITKEMFQRQEDSEFFAENFKKFCSHRRMFQS